MKGRGWIVVVLLLAVVLGLTVLVPRRPSSCPNHASNCDAPEGTSALLQLATAMGRPARAITHDFSLPDQRGLVFVISPGPETTFSTPQADRAWSWVQDGGTLVYASEEGDQALDQRLGADFTEPLFGRVTPGDQGDREALTYLTSPIEPAADQLTGGTTATVLATSAAQVPLLRSSSPSSDVVGYVERAGKGRVVVLGDPALLSNERLKAAANGHFAEDLISLVPAGAPVAFDEVHHAAASDTGGEAINDWATTPWGLALVWALLVAYVGLLLRGRGFGPQVPLRPAGERSSAEYASAVGALLRRARARALTFNVILDSTRRALAERTGLGHTASPDRLLPALQQRAPALARDLEAAAQVPPGGEPSDAELLRAARRLHALAYPSAQRKA